ncbi:hypothetical protein HME7025_00072 [Aquirufa nivalisilvae]|uniref:Uncharacterized protein n=1 Tax=Aquirufa nivalisilvae TaxID=2516557 RepID=A0A2S2DT01_9BACT|nr:hypothetical protein [Aquirufa nivalisilvae]AWL07957.1 hypothetical protein HME7025_00072 [Aquirufa nivalisilvae]
MKLKTYILTVSRYYPSTHPRKGQETHFVGKIGKVLLGYLEEKYGRHAIGGIIDLYNFDGGWKLDPKYHTMRANYGLWEKRIKEVQEGKAVLSLRYWEGRPYNSNQVEFAQLHKGSGVGVQKLEFEDEEFENPVIIGPLHDFFLNNIELLANNDGLSLNDFKAWFKGYNISQPMAIIHFTPFRY